MSDTISTESNIQAGSFRAIGAKFKLPLIAFVLTAAIAGTLSVLPFFLMGQRPASSKSHMMLLETHDLGMHVPQAMDLDNSVRAGGLYPRWLSNINHGYGVGTMIFYPPVFFHLLVLFNALVGGWAAAVFAVTLLSFIASALTFYLLARQSYGKFASAVGAFFYMLFPYHLLDFYWRGAVPEVMGFALLPVVVYFALKLEEGGRLKHLAGLGFFYGIYLLTHMPVGYLLTYTLAFYAVVRAIKKHDIRIAVRIAVGIAIGLMLSAIYWLPAAIETKQVYEWGTELLPYHRTYITLMEPTNLFEQIIHISFTILAIVTILAVAIPRLSKAGNHSDTPGATSARSLQIASQTQTWVVMSAFALFMSCSFSRYISMLIPRIQISTPAWRWLVIATMFATLLLTATIDRLMTDEGVSRVKAWAFNAAVGAIVIGAIWYGAQYSVAAALTKPSFEPNPVYVDSAFTPRDATRPQDLPDTPRVMISPENGVIGNVIWEPEYRQIELKLDTASEVRLKTYNYPGWTARVDGQKVPMLSDKDGIQLINVPPGLHKIEATFESTPPRMIGATASTVAFFLIVALTLADTFKQRGRRPERAAAASQYGEEASTLAESKSKGLALLRKKSVAGAIGLLIIAAIAVAITVSRSNRKSNSGTGAPAAGAGSRGGSLAPGSEIRLYVEGLDAIPFATDERALDALMGALAAKDASKVDALRDSGRIINVVRNTKVQVIEPGSGRLKVRIAEGGHLGKEGWVPERWVR